jgi:hypothetical protein
MFDLPNSSKISNSFPDNNNYISNISIKNLLLSVPASITNLPNNHIIDGVVISRNLLNNITTIKTLNGIFTVQTPLNLSENSKVQFNLHNEFQSLHMQLVSINDKDMNSYNGNKDNFLFRMQNEQNLTISTNNLEVHDNINISSSTISTVGLNKFSASLVEPNLQAFNNLIEQLIISGEIESISQLDVMFKSNKRKFKSDSSALRELLNNSSSKANINLLQDLNHSILNYKIANKSSSIETILPNNSKFELNVKPSSINSNVKFNDNDSIIFNEIKLVKYHDNNDVKNSLNMQVILLHRNTNGESLLKTPLGIFKTNNIDFSENTFFEVEFNLVNSTNLDDNQSTSPIRSLSEIVNGIAIKWNSLNNDAEPADIDQTHAIIKFLKSIIPLNNHHLIINILNFISAIKGGELGEWQIPDNIKTFIKNGKKNLINNILQDILTLKNLITPININNNWQALIFPFSEGENINQTRIFIRNNRQDLQQQSNENSIIDTRFIIELETEMLGNFQFDGLIKSSKINNKASNFDMIIRSSNALPEKITRSIQDIFSETSSLTGLNGIIRFQKVNEFPVNPLNEMNNFDQPMSDIIV